MTIAEIIKQLVNTDDYAKIRVAISDDLILFIKETLPSDYELIEDMENNYQLNK